MENSLIGTLSGSVQSPARLVALARFSLAVGFGLAFVQVPAAGQAAKHYPLNRDSLIANYTIAARLEPSTRTVAGTQLITWRNRTGSSADHLLFHLYLNAFQNDRSTFAREGGFQLDWGVSGDIPELYRGSITVTSLKVHAPSEPLENRAAGRYFVQPDDGNEEDKTVLRVDLDRSVGPGQEIQVEMEFLARLPRGIARTGWVDDYFFVAQWFPKIGVLEESGWNCHQYHRNTEYYSDFGTYDVTLQVPSDHVVGATGNLVEMSQVSEVTEYRFAAEFVHDFAWTSSPRFGRFQRVFEHPELPPVNVNLLLLPEHASYKERYFTAVFVALQYYGEWFGPYPYRTLTVVDPAFRSRSGGMEYPMLVTGGVLLGAPERVLSPESVTVHEVGHQWWYGMVANNEFEEAWLDEGINSWAEVRLLARAYSPPLYSRRFFGVLPLTSNVEKPFASSGLSKLRRDGRLDPMTTTSWQTRNRSSYRVNSYSKPRLVLATLENLMGEDLFLRAMRAYFQRYAFRHPTTRDFKKTLNEVSGSSWDWFFDQTFHSNDFLDYAVASLVSTAVPRSKRSGGRDDLPAEEEIYSCEVMVQRNGNVRLPVSVQVVFEDGTELREQWDGQAPWRRFSYEGPQRLSMARVDPDDLLLIDVNPANNSRRDSSDTFPLAALKWAALWMFWFQNLIETLGLVG